MNLSCLFGRIEIIFMTWPGLLLQAIDTACRKTKESRNYLKSVCKST